jgi:hypothetical protein
LDLSSAHVPHLHLPSGHWQSFGQTQGPVDSVLVLQQDMI